ncbi:MAG TPA: DsbA family protein [Gemmatimonadales bacterium]|nr:DsbA family protein [Gemmatimonadales bacterium]
MRRGSVLAAALLTLAAARQAPDPMAPRTKGRADAPVTVFEMSDFQCPFCRMFAMNTMPALDSEYVRTGKVRFVYINMPLPQHPNAPAAAAAALCAARQHKFWQMHDLLFRNQDTWARLPYPRAALLALGDSAGVNHAAFVQCVTSGATRAEVDEDARRAHQAGGRSTPTFYIEGGLLEGAQPIDVFRSVLDSIYRTKTTHS